MGSEAWPQLAGGCGDTCDTNPQDTPFSSKNGPFPMEEAAEPLQNPIGICLHIALATISLANLRALKFPTESKYSQKAEVAKEENPSWPCPGPARHGSGVGTEGLMDTNWSLTEGNIFNWGCLVLGQLS